MSTYWPGPQQHTVLVCESIDLTVQDPVGFFWDYARTFLKRYDCPLSFIEHDGATKYLTYSRLANKMSEIILRTKYLGICSIPPGAKFSHVNYLAKLDVVLPQRLIRIDIEGSRVPIRSAFFTEMTDYILNYYNPKYCYAFTRPIDCHPDLYAYGFGTDNDPPNQRQNNWFYYGRLNEVYLRGGWLREVYALNYLTKAHLFARVGNSTLKQWIEESPQRGRLAPAVRDLTLWEVPDEHLNVVSDQLYEAGRVFDAERDVHSTASDQAEPIQMDQAVATVAQAFGFESPDEVEIRKGDNKPVSDEEKKRIFKNKPPKTQPE